MKSLEDKRPLFFKFPTKKAHDIDNVIHNSPLRSHKTGAGFQKESPKVLKVPVEFLKRETQGLMGNGVQSRLLPPLGRAMHPSVTKRLIVARRETGRGD